MKIKLFSFVIIFFFFYSCEVRFDSNVRVESKGRIIDENNIPISSMDISINTLDSRSTGFYPYPSGNSLYVLGYGTSNDQGNFNLTSLFSSGEDFHILVGKENDEFTDYIYSPNAPNDYFFDLGEVQLKRLATINLNISRTSLPSTTLDFNINYQSPYCEEVFINGVLDEASSNCFRVESIFRTLDDDNPEFMDSFSSFITGTIQFNYSINGGNQITETFIINQNNYEINFSY